MASSKDLWTLASQEREKDSSSEEERTVLLVGSKGAGKTTMIYRFLEKNDETPKPTLALEYTFGRKARGNETMRDIAHIWELGGGSSHAKLVETPITANTIRSLSVALVLDLSTPNQIWQTMETLLSSIRGRVDRILSDLTSKDSRLPQHLKKKAWSKYGDDHPDKDILDPVPFNLTLIGSKYDLFQDLEPEKRKIICKTIRFVAHVNGAGVLFTSDKSDALVHRCRALLGTMAFKSSSSRSVSVDHNTPLIISPASDSLTQIGPPPIDPDDFGRVNAKNPMDLWRTAYSSIFPNESTVVADTENPVSDPKYADQLIDACRAQKDEELERYRKQAERRARELAQKQAASSSSSSTGDSGYAAEQDPSPSQSSSSLSSSASKPPKRSSKSKA